MFIQGVSLQANLLALIFRCIMAGNHKFVFLVRGHVILVAVAYTQESVTQVNKSALIVQEQPLA